MNNYYIFLAYKSEDEYPLKPFHRKIFDDFDKMKNHSGKHSKRFKHKQYYPNYVSTYSKIEL